MITLEGERVGDACEMMNGYRIDENRNWCLIPISSSSSQQETIRDKRDKKAKWR